MKKKRRKELEKKKNLSQPEWVNHICKSGLVNRDKTIKREKNQSLISNKSNIKWWNSKKKQLTNRASQVNFATWIMWMRWVNRKQIRTDYDAQF